MGSPSSAASPPRPAAGAGAAAPRLPSGVRAPHPSPACSSPVTDGPAGACPTATAASRALIVGEQPRHADPMLKRQPAAPGGRKAATGARRLSVTLRRPSVEEGFSVVIDTSHDGVHHVSRVAEGGHADG
eukprot:gene53055-25957_t